MADTELIHDETAGIERLLEIMRALRNPKTGCPWDVAQDFATIAPYTIEEAYEVADAIERGDMDELKGELGDLLLQVVYHGEIGAEAGHFDFDAVAEGVAQKMVDRHPHIFGDESRDKSAEQQTIDGEVQKAKDKFLWTVSRESPEDKLSDFYDRSEGLIQVMRRQEALRRVLTPLVHGIFGGVNFLVEKIVILRYLKMQPIFLMLSCCFNLANMYWQYREQYPWIVEEEYGFFKEMLEFDQQACGYHQQQLRRHLLQ